MNLDGRRPCSATERVAAVAAALLCLAQAGPLAAKDIGPLSDRCDAFAKASAEWRRCVGAAPATDSERFYAGYWLAKSGAYEAALAQLRLVAEPDVRVLTYIGFSYRKLGAIDDALRHYYRALDADPDFTVARAYLGEAYLMLDDRGRAAGELVEIEARCGRGCAEYADLAVHIARYDEQRASAGRG